MRRREFITLVGGAAAWPLAASAQHEVKRIGVLMPTVPTDAEVQERISALRTGLQELGWIEGHNYRFEYRWPGPDTERLRAHVAELVELAPDVIIAGTTPGTLALKQATRTIPIVFGNIADPVANGVVTSLARPGGNVTGFLAYEDVTAGKWLELLKEIAPRVARVGYVFGAQEQFGPNGELFRKVLEATAPSFSVELIPLRIRSAAEIEPLIEGFAAVPNGGLVAAAEAGAMRNRAVIIGAAARHRLPAVYPFRFCAEDGGLAAYGSNLNDQYRRMASYLDRIFKGAKPADLPVQAPIKYELVINLKTANALGLTVPDKLLARADEVIE
jgi:putative tryptophan/tyrosine transport system substrate-binding protein